MELTNRLLLIWWIFKITRRLWITR